MRDGIEFEFDVCGDMDQDNTLTVSKSRCPALAGQAINRPGKEVAATLRKWLSSGEAQPAEAPATPKPATASNPAPSAPPAPRPATPATPPVPDAIAAMWGRMTTVATVCSEFEALKRAISQFSGADQAYYDILGRHGMSHANDCRAVGMTKTRQAAREIFETIARWQGANQPPAVSPITDDRDTWVPEFDSPAPLNPAVAMTAEMRDRLAGKVA
jgi:hypothetical protein